MALSPTDYENARLVGYLGQSIKNAIHALESKSPNNVQWALKELRNALAEEARSEAVKASRRAQLAAQADEAYAKFKAPANG